ncbi:MAG: Uma2 family endonuclease [Planctomycetota bacterium]
MGSSVSPQILDASPGYVMHVASGPYRLEDYLALPDEPRVELIQGRFYLSPAPILLHQVVSITLTHWLYGVARDSGGQAFAAPCDLQLAEDTVVQPDLMYFDPERRQPMGPRLTAAPDLVIEILSTNAARDRVQKASLYAMHGVAEYWIVDPINRSIEFFVLVDGKYQVQPQRSAEYASPRRDGLVLDLAMFWSEVDRQIA